MRGGIGVAKMPTKVEKGWWEVAKAAGPSVYEILGTAVIR